MSDKYMKNLTFANIAKACDGTYIGDETLLDTTITGAVIDSRQVKEGYLFIPIKGERVDGHKFIPTVFEQGAAIVLSEHELTDPAGPYVLVESTTDAMKKLAAFYRKNLDIKVVGITGSVGKTSTKEMISSVLEQKYSVHKTAGNFNNEIGLPLTIFGIRESHQVAVLEMGISDFGEMHRLSTMSCPDVMVITNIGYCHLEFLGDRDGVLKAKTECFEHMMPDGDETLLDTTITGAVIDSRQVKEGYLFIPIKGERVDGHKFIPTVFEQGAAIVLSEHELTDPAGPYVLVESTTDAMKKLAAFYRKNLDIKVVGITGSVGKTSTKEMISSVLEQKYSVHKTAGNFNNEIGLPLTIFGIRESHQVAVLEMGISDFGEMHRLSTMSCPDVMVITNIGYCHLEFLGDRDGVLKAKTECFEHMMPDAVAVLNADDDKLATVQTVNGKPAIYYGKESASGVHKSVYTTNIENLGFDGMKAHFVTPEGEFDAQIHIPGEHNVYNAMAAAAVGLQLGLTIAEIKSGIEKAETIAGRTNFIKTHGMTVIDDCYNANPVSMKSSIEVLSHAKGRTIAVLGDMGELGSDEKKLHHEVGEAVGENHIHTLFAAGELAKEYAAGAAEKSSDVDIHYFEDRETMTQELLSYVKEGDTILVKASHFMEFPKVVEALSE